MVITGREAARRIRERHLLSLRESQRVIGSGLAGARRPMGSALLYDEGDVETLLGRPLCPTSVLDRWIPFIARLGRGRDLAATDPWATQAERACGGWYLTPFTLRQARDGYAPGRCAFVGTIGGFAAFGADIVGLSADSGTAAHARSRASPTCTVDLEPPGECWKDVEQTWLPLKNGATSRMWRQATTTPLTLDGRPVDWLRANALELAERALAAEQTHSTWAVRAEAARAARPPGPR